MPVVLGVDSSTQSCKAERRDAESGALLGVGRAPHPATTPPRSEQDPAAWWDVLQRAASAAGGRDVDAVSVAGQQHGMVVLDDAGAVVRPAKLWNDTEAAPDAEWLVQQLGGPEAWVAACGSVPLAAFTISKLSWLHRSEPDAWARLARVCLPHDWLTLQLAGEFVTDRGDASGTGYFNAAENRYRMDLLAVVDATADWSTRLPRVLGPGDGAGVTRAFGTEAIVAAGTGDNMAAALGIGLTAGDVVVSIGTSGTVFAVSDVPTADASGAVAAFADATGRFLPLVCTLNATKVTDAVARLLGVDAAGLDALALDAQGSGDGDDVGDLVLVPYFDGERVPNRPHATGSVVGLRSDVSREAVASAAFRGVVCGLLDGMDALEAVGVPTTGRLVLVGGGARSAAYRQVLADLAGRPVLVPDAAEHVAAGACVQAAATLLGCTSDVVATAWGLGAGSVVEPRPVDREAIRARYSEAVHG
jgi:xylulokinase